MIDKTHMKLWLPISLLIIAAILAAGVTNIGKSRLPATPPTFTDDTVPEIIAQANLALIPEVNAVSPGANANFSVMVDTGALRSFGVEGYFDYDPNVLTILGIEPGNFFDQPEVLLTSIDPTLGKISYAVGSRNSAQGKGIAFIIKTKVKSQVQAQPLILSFNQQKSHVSLEASDQSKRFAQEETLVVFEEKPFTVLAQE